jgi:hypothetical protein
MRTMSTKLSSDANALVIYLDGVGLVCCGLHARHKLHCETSDWKTLLFCTRELCTIEYMCIISFVPGNTRSARCSWL